MKKLLSIIAAAAALVAVAPSAQAGHDGREFVGYDRCGNMVYRVRVFVGYDECGHPVYRCRTQVVPRCEPRYEPPVYDSCSSGYRAHRASYRRTYEAYPGHRTVRW